MRFLPTVIVVFSLSLTFALEYVDEELDAVVIEANEGNGREQKNIYWPWAQVNPFPINKNTCFSPTGRKGNCVSLQECFPFYQLQHNLPNWALGKKNYCSTDTTSEVSDGICCNSRQFVHYPTLPNYPASHFPNQQIFYPGSISQFLPGQGLQSPGIIQQSPSLPVKKPIHSQSNHPSVATTTSTTSTTEKTVIQESKKCGVGRYFPIKYAENGEDHEAMNRLTKEHPLRVVNGWPADKNEWPWIAALMNNGRQFCGGSLIDENHILTAAHCVAQMTATDVQRLTVRLGEHRIKTPGEDIFETSVSRVVRHKRFSSETLYDDVALITLKNKVPASKNSTIRPVCLPSSTERYTGRMATVVGWGGLSEHGPQPDVLQELTMEIWNNEKCEKIYQGVSPAGIQTSMMCAGQKGKDACMGDSGGPLVLGNGPTWVQIGIVSWGIGCGKADYPGVYTRTTDVKNWIDRVRQKF